MTTTYELDGSYRRHERVVIAGSPLRLFRLSEAGRRVVEAIEQHRPLPSKHTGLTNRLLDAGAIHPSPDASPFTSADVTIVVPAYNARPAFTAHSGPTIVVDDGSDPRLAPVPGCTMIHLPVNRGPGAARNAGLANVDTPLVAFVDTDVEPAEGWLEALLPFFDDPRLALVAPRVASSAARGALAGYETARSPLDLGPQRGRIFPGTRVSYVPAAVIVVRVDALRAVGGFDETLRTGEDVDVVWRLIDAGHRCRYEPAVIVHHRPRASLTAWVRQRVDYGRSAAALDQRHPGAVTPLRMSGWSALVWTLMLTRRPRAALLVAGWNVRALQRKLVDVPPQESLRLVGLGHLYAGRQVANAITRVWWPIALLVAAFVPRTRLPLLAAAVVPPLLDWIPTRGPGDPVRYVALRLADDVAYGSGVWIGAIERGRAGALAPTFTNWPGRASG